MLRALVETDSEFNIGKGQSPLSGFYRARRLVLAIDRLSHALNQNRSVPLKLDNELNVLRQDVGDVGNFEGPRFAEHLRALRGKL
jgi:hypothetical protein